MWWEKEGEAVVKEIIATSAGVREGIDRLLAYFQKRYPHPVWVEMAKLDYEGETEAIQAWFVHQLPVDPNIEVFWFAFCDVTEAFRLRGASDWSGDPEDWEWWYHDEFRGQLYESKTLRKMHRIAKDAEDPTKVPRIKGGVWDLMEYLLTIGYVGLAAAETFRKTDPQRLLVGCKERWIVTGFPDAVYGIIVGRVTPEGFEPFTGVGPTPKKPRRHPITPTLDDRIAQLGDKDRLIRFKAILALGSMGPDAKIAIPFLIKGLNDDNSTNRQCATGALIKIDPQSDVVVSALIASLEVDQRPNVRHSIVQALGRSGRETAITALRTSLTDADPKMRYYSAIALKVLGRKAKIAVPNIRKLLETETDEAIRLQAETALKVMENEQN